MVQARDVSSVSWSPTSRSIAFTAAGPRDADVFVVGTDGRGLRRLTGAGHDSGVGWRP
jgi:Tol biopolymer transport system component